MITNILLGLILGVIITGFIILNKKINKIDKYTRITLSNTNVIDTTVDNNNKMINIVLDRFNDFVLRYNELNGLLETKVNYNIEYFDKTLTSINDKITEVNEYIVTTRNDIKKLAKISSKKKQASKQSKSINKQ